MSSLSIARIQPLHQEFVAAAETYPHLGLILARPHDSIVPWPEFPMIEERGSTMLGLSPGWWQQVRSELRRDSEKCFSTVVPVWLSVDGALWNGGFYWDEDILGLKRPSDIRRASTKFQKAVELFLDLADSAAHHFEMPPDPDFWGEGIALLEARGGHRWLEKLHCMGLYESCAGCSTQIRRLKANIFLASARAIEALSENQHSPLFGTIEEASQSWLEGFDIVATRLNRVLAAKGSKCEIRCRRPEPTSSLLSCRKRLAQAFRDIPLYISKLPDANSDNWQPWPVGSINSGSNPARFVGFNFMPTTGDELDQVESLLRERPEEWPWYANIVEVIEQERRNWETIIEQMRVRLSNGQHTKPGPENEVDRSTVLSGTKQDILLALLECKAIDSNTRVLSKDIAVKVAGKMAKRGTFKARLSDMKKAGLLDSYRGSDGGYWLAAWGLQQAEKIQAARKSQTGSSKAATIP